MSEMIVQQIENELTAIEKCEKEIKIRESNIHELCKTFAERKLSKNKELKKKNA